MSHVTREGKSRTPGQWLLRIRFALGMYPPVTCFISHSHLNAEFARRLSVGLKSQGVRILSAPESMHGGEYLYVQIEEALKIVDRVILVLSEESMKSAWVRQEIRKTIQREREEGRRILFPISLVPYDDVQGWSCFDEDLKVDMANEIRKYFLPNFVGWEENHVFEQHVAKLVEDLLINE